MVIVRAIRQIRLVQTGVVPAHDRGHIVASEWHAIDFHVRRELTAEVLRTASLGQPVGRSSDPRFATPSSSIGNWRLVSGEASACPSSVTLRKSSGESWSYCSSAPAVNNRMIAAGWTAIR